MKKRSIYLILSLFSLLFAGCKYDFILPVPEAPVPTTISFATDVAPIFSNNSKCTSCHKPGGQSPDLTASAAYASLVPALVNTASPSDSKIYTFPNPTTSTHSWKKLTATEAATILAWITKGAPNN